MQNGYVAFSFLGSRVNVRAAIDAYVPPFYPDYYTNSVKSLVLSLFDRNSAVATDPVQVTVYATSDQPGTQDENTGAFTPSGPAVEVFQFSVSTFSTSRLV